MRSMIVTAVLLLACAAAAGDTERVLELYGAGLEAAEAEDWDGYLEKMDAALGVVPEHPVLVRRRAEALTQLGRLDEAMVEIERLLAMGVATTLYRDHELLAPLRETAAWGALADRLAAAEEPLGTYEETFVLPADLIPEGIAHDPVTETFYVSSTVGRRIVKVGPDGAVSDLFAAGEHGYLCGLGIAIDAGRRRLWTVSEAPLDSVLFTADELAASALHAFDLDTGGLLDAWSLRGEPAHGLNDVCLLPDGSVVATGAGSGALLQFRLGQDAWDEIVPPGTIAGANGICVAADGRSLYVSEYSMGIVRVRLADGAVTRAFAGGDFTTVGVDGLYRHGDRLVAVQNYAGLDRAAVFALDAEGRIVGCTPLVARHEFFDDPTTGVIVGDTFHFIADSHVSPFFGREDKTERTGFGTTTVVGVGLAE